MDSHWSSVRQSRGPYRCQVVWFLKYCKISWTKLFFGQNMRLVSTKNTCRSSFIFKHGTAWFRFVDLHSGNMSFLPLSYHAFCNVNLTWNQCESWVFYIYDLLSIKMILFDILDVWCQFEEIRFVKIFRNVACSFHSWKFQRVDYYTAWSNWTKKMWKETEAAKPRPILETLFWRPDLKKT